MLSREAEALYWVGRMMERVEVTARRLDVEYHSRLEVSADPGAPGLWSSLLAVLGELKTFRARYADEDDRDLLTFLLLDATNPNSIRSCITAARENARGLRGEITTEMWEHLNRVYLEMGEQTIESVERRTPHEFLRWVTSSCRLFDGIAEATMPRGEGWHFFRCGKFLERAEAVARVTSGMALPVTAPDAGVSDGLDLPRWTALLKSAGAYEAYWKAHTSINPADAIAFVLFNARFPGTARYALTRVDQTLRLIDGTSDAEDENDAVRFAGRLLARLVHARVTELLADLDPFVSELIRDGAALHDAIVRTYFSHLAWRPWEMEAPDDDRIATGGGRIRSPCRRQMLVAAQQ